MIRARMFMGVLVMAVLCLPAGGGAEVPDTAVEISIDPSSQTAATAARCTGFELLLANTDCTYNQSSIYAGPWTGPVLSDGFYGLGDGLEFVDPMLPPGNLGIPLSGTLVIDGQGTADCADDTLSGVIEMAPFTRNYFDGPIPGLRQVDNFPGGIVQTIATTPFASGVPNAAGGCDYTLGSQGVPELLSGPGGEFPGMAMTMPQWDFPASVEISRFAATSTPNPGAQAVATIGAGYSCLAFSGPCTSTLALAWNQAGKASWNNITGMLSTSAAGDLLQAFLYVVHDNFAIGSFGGQPVNAFGYTVMLTGSPVPPPPEAVADSAITAQDLPVVIDVLANDQFLQDPLTVTITTAPASGSAVVAGSPGAAADIAVTYTPDAGFTGEDAFVYRVETALGAAEATVTVTVLLPGANDDQATTVSSAITSIDVLANDFGFTDPVRLQILLPPDGGGQAEVVDSTGASVPDGVGAQDDLRVRFVPGPLPFDADSAVERFTYQVTGPVAGPVPRAFRLTRIVIERDLAPTIDSNGSTPNLYNRIDDGFAIVTGKSVRIPAISFVTILSPVPALPLLDQLWFRYTGVFLTTTLGSGVTAAKIDVDCANGSATPPPCPAPRGLLGDWVTGQLTDGTPSNLSRVDVSLDGDVLTLVRQTEHYDCTVGVAGEVPPPGVCPDNNRIRYTFYFTADESAFTAAFDDLAPLPGLAPVSIDVLANDIGFVAPLAVAIVSQPLQGMATVVGSPGAPDDIRVLYTPGAGFTGSDSFRYQVDDGVNTRIATVRVVAERQDTAEVAVTVLARGANEDRVNLFDFTPVDIDVLANDQGLQDPVSVAVIAGPVIGSAEVLNASGPQSAVRIRYTPAPGFRGIDTLAYAVTDTAGTEVATVGVAVALAQGDLVVTPQGQPLEIDVLGNDLVLEGPQAVQVISGPANGSAVVIGSPGSAEDIRIIYTPDPGFPAVGARDVDAFTYEFTDGPYAGRAEVRIEVFVDADGDGVVDDVDNCLGVFNPDQLDVDGDGFGNLCDADFNNDGVVNFADLALFRGRFGTSQPELDLNGDGAVNFADLAIFRALFGKPPGPSALAP